MPVYLTCTVSLRASAGLKSLTEPSTAALSQRPLPAGCNKSPVLSDSHSVIENPFAVASPPLRRWHSSPYFWTGEHFFAVNHDVPGQDMVHLTGDFLTKIFEGPYKDAPKMERDMQRIVSNRGKQVKKTYFFYTTCPKCAKYYGKNYMIAVAEIEWSANAV